VILPVRNETAEQRRMRAFPSRRRSFDYAGTEMLIR
jgi:hypothetical protein